jgi:hypothetical protein
MAHADPTFLILGAQKCGTSWLAAMLRQHPDVHLSEHKEVHFFNKADRYARGLPWYRAQFDGYAGETAVGEATPNYFWTGAEGLSIDTPGVDIPERVARHYPGLKLIVLLRDPVAQAISAYYHHIRAGRVKPRERLLDVMHRYGILAMGFYDVHLGRCWHHFDRERVLVRIYEEDVRACKAATLTDVFAFLDVDPSFVPNDADVRRNARSGHLYMRLKHVAPRVAWHVNQRLPDWIMDHPWARIPVADAEGKALAEVYAPHNARLAQMLGRRVPEAWSAPAVEDDRGVLTS